MVSACPKISPALSVCVMTCRFVSSDTLCFSFNLWLRRGLSATHCASETAIERSGTLRTRNSFDSSSVDQSLSGRGDSTNCSE